MCGNLNNIYKYKLIMEDLKDIQQPSIKSGTSRFTTHNNRYEKPFLHRYNNFLTHTESIQEEQMLNDNVIY